jgi:hypothetical protein
MTDSIGFDFTAVNKLAADLSKAAGATDVTVPKAVEVTARKIKDDWNGQLYRDGHASRTGRSITYDLLVARHEFQAEIGAVRGSGRQAYITRLLEYGSANNPPHGAGAGALDSNTDDFVNGLQKAADDALKEAGL